MQLLPIPQTDEYLDGMFPYWSRFLPDIAKRSKEPIATLLQRVASKEVQPILAWDETANEPVGLAGIRYHMRGNDRIAEWLWMTGHNRASWMPLLAELERYLKERER